MANELQIKISTTADTQALSNTKNLLKSVEESSYSASRGLKTAEDDMTSMMRRASELYNQDPLQRYKQSVLELNVLQKNGLIDTRLYASEHQRLESQLKASTASTTSFKTSLLSMGSALTGLVIAGVTSEFVKTADAMNRLDGRLSLATKSTSEFKSEQIALRDIAKETHAPIQGITDLFVKLNPSLSAMGANTSTVNKVVSDFSKGLKLGGASAQESSAAILQFGQAMGSGVLRGDEFNSMMEASPKLMSYMAEGLGVPITTLRQMAEKGELTAGKVSAALLTMSSKMDEDFKKLPKTVGDASVDFKNSLGITIQEIDKATGVTSTLSGALTDMAGYFRGSSSNIIDSINTVKEYKGEIETAGVAIGAFYGVTLLGTGVNALREIELATKIATLTQLSFNTVVAVNPWVVIAGGISLAVAGLYEYRGLIQDIEKSQANVMGQKNFQNDLQFLKGKDNGQKLSDVEKRSKEVHDAEVATINEIEKRRGYAYQGSKNDDIVDNLQKRQSALHAEQESLLKLHGSLVQVKKDREQKEPTSKESKEAQELKEQIELLKNAASPKKDDSKKREAEAKKAAEEAEKLKQAYLAIDKDIASFGKNEHDKAIANINDKVEHYRKAGIDQVKLAELKTAMLKKLEDDETKEYLKKDGEKRKTFEDYYTTIGDSSSAFYMKESDKIQKLAEENILSNEQILKIYEVDTKKFETEENKRKKDQWNKDNQGFVDLLSNVNKAMDEQFFNVMSGKFTSFGSWLKDLWGSITQSLARGLSKTLADSILGTGTGVEGGIVNLFKNFGGFSGSMGSSASLVGTTLSADNITSLGGEIGKAFTTSSGTSVDASGIVSASGTDLSGVLNLASNLKSVYGLYTNGIEGTLMAPSAYMGQLAGTVYEAGFTGTGSFLAGSANVLGGGGVSGLSGAAAAGGLLTAGVMGGVGGYALGSLGDKLFGTDTKAGTYGAVGGAIGAVIGSVVPVIGTIAGGVVGSVLGSVIGGAFGSSHTSISGTGMVLNETASADRINAQHYTTTHEEKSSWFGSSSSDVTYYGAFTQGDMQNYKNTFTAYNFLLKQLNTSGSVTVAAGQYTYDGFNKAITEGFIHSFNTNLNQIRLDAIYNDWVAYATSVNKTVQQAMADATTTYISETRSFTEWKMGSGTKEQLKFTSDYMTSDLAQLEAQMGISGVNKDNFLESYQGAIKDNFTAETIDVWKKLGDAIQSTSDANQKYADSLKQTADAANALRASAHNDMMLSKTSDVSGLIHGTSGSVSKAMLDALTTLVNEAKRQTTLAQLSAGRA